MIEDIHRVLEPVGCIAAGVVLAGNSVMANMSEECPEDIGAIPEV